MKECSSANRFKLLVSLVICGVCILFHNCGSKPAEVEKVNQVIYDLIEADNNADLPNILKAYADSIEFYPAGKEATKGLDKVEASYKDLFSQNTLLLKTQILETKIFGNKATVKGINRGTRFSLSDSVSHVINDSYVASLVRDSQGAWKIYRLFWEAIP